MGRGRAGDEIDRRIDSLAPWFHNLHLPSGHQTAPDHPLGDFPSFKWKQLQAHIPQDLHGWSVLDIGCNAGFYSFALADRGADVLAIDHDEHYLEQACWAAPMFGFSGSVRFERLGVYDLADMRESFDLVLFMGVLYHLRYPLLAFDLVASKTGKLLVFQTLTMPGEEEVEPPEDLGIDERDRMLHPGWPKMAFIERNLAGDPTNWWAPNHAAIEAMLRSAGMRVVERPGHEIYICAPMEGRDEIRSELQDAIGRTGRVFTTQGKG
ncbi:MAG TPA: TIGR04290 family methyltransferase [Actinomycetota bacterium]|nr:TIGR04290 family methyltransferase [Actinomycetota bacterium]